MRVLPYTILAVIAAVILNSEQALAVPCSQNPENHALAIDSVPTLKKKKKRKKLTPEEKQRIKELDAIVKTAKRQRSKEEKKRIQLLTILEEDLRNWFKDQQSEWYCMGALQIIKGSIPADLYIKRGATTHVEICYRGIRYEAIRWYNGQRNTHWKVYINGRYRYFNLPSDIDVPTSGDFHPEYKHYNPVEELDKLKRREIKSLKIKK